MWKRNTSPDFSGQYNEPGGIKAAFLFIWELVKVIIISLAIILPIRYFLVQPFYVKGASMEPNFLDHDYLLIDEISYRLREPERGEVVVFRYPRDRSQFFIKRIIGLPNEQLVLKDSKIFIDQGDNNLVELPEPYLSQELITTGDIDVSLGFNEYYLLGDNRTSSLDSRSFGTIERSDMIGRAWVRGWPFDRWAWFSVPDSTNNFIDLN
ncbi:MAG: signal peptidase I [Patescibacteria group bacterium]